ncbi:MAG: hypothetical protein AAFQ41_07085 [Cyanobacteria bacterium J06623_7]
MNRRIIFKASATLVGIGVAINTSMHNQALFKETKQEMLSICSTNNDCVQALNNSFDRCYDNSINDDILDLVQLANCVNEYAGKSYFAYEY